MHADRERERERERENELGRDSHWTDFAALLMIFLDSGLDGKKVGQILVAMRAGERAGEVALPESISR